MPEVAVYEYEHFGVVEDNIGTARERSYVPFKAESLAFQ